MTTSPTPASAAKDEQRLDELVRRSIENGSEEEARLDELIAMSDPASAANSEALAENVSAFVAEYEFRGGGDYTPNEGERILIEDAIHGFLSVLEPNQLPVGADAMALAQELVSGLAPDQGEAPDWAWSLAVRLQQALQPHPSQQVETEGARIQILEGGIQEARRQLNDMQGDCVFYNLGVALEESAALKTLEAIRG